VFGAPGPRFRRPGTLLPYAAASVPASPAGGCCRQCTRTARIARRRPRRSSACAACAAGFIIAPTAIIRYRRRRRTRTAGRAEFEPASSSVRGSTELAGWPDHTDDRHRAGEGQNRPAVRRRVGLVQKSIEFPEHFFNWGTYETVVKKAARRPISVVNEIMEVPVLAPAAK
jgi:hypothetical protein